MVGGIEAGKARVEMDRADIANLPCPCASGKTFGQCCQAEDVDPDALRENTVTALRAAGAAPELVYAYERTGLVVISTYRNRFSAADLDEWDDAVCEFREKYPIN